MCRVPKYPFSLPQSLPLPVMLDMANFTTDQVDLASVGIGAHASIVVLSLSQSPSKIFNFFLLY